MSINTQMFFLLAVGFLFCMLGCGSDEDGILTSADIATLMADDTSAETPAVEAPSVEATVSFNDNILPILTERCALAGCHIAGGPDNLDFSTYQAFKRGGEDGPVFIPGNAEESDVIEEILSGRMPPGGPPLTDAQIQLFIDWINEGATDDSPGNSDPDDSDDDDDDDDDDD